MASGELDSWHVNYSLPVVRKNSFFLCLPQSIPLKVIHLMLTNGELILATRRATGDVCTHLTRPVTGGFFSRRPKSYLALCGLRIARQHFWVGRAVKNRLEIAFEQGEAALLTLFSVESTITCLQCQRVYQASERPAKRLEYRPGLRRSRRRMVVAGRVAGRK